MQQRRALYFVHPSYAQRLGARFTKYCRSCCKMSQSDAEDSVHNLELFLRYLETLLRLGDELRTLR